MRRRIAAAVMVAMGLALIGLTVGMNLFARTQANEELSRGFKPLMGKAFLSQLRTDSDNFKAALTEFNEKAVPMLAGVQQTTPEAVRASIAKDYPAAWVVLDELPGTLTKYVGLIDMFETQRDNFESADAIPTKSVPSTAMPWAMVVLGVMVVGIGILMFRPGVAAPAGMLAMGLALLLGPLALSFPSKAVDADAVNAAFKPIITKELVADGKRILGSLDQMSTDMDLMIGELGQSMGLDPAQTSGLMADAFPTFTAMMSDLPTRTERYERLIGTVDENIDNYYLIRNMAFTPFVWVYLVIGIAMTLAGAFVFRLERVLARAARLAGASVPAPAPIANG